MEVKDLIAKMSASLLKRRSMPQAKAFQPIVSSLPDRRTTGETWPIRQIRPFKPQPPNRPASNM
jgi:hypothetical protein